MTILKYPDRQTVKENLISVMGVNEHTEKELKQLIDRMATEFAFIEVWGRDGVQHEVDCTFRDMEIEVPESVYARWRIIDLNEEIASHLYKMVQT